MKSVTERKLNILRHMLGINDPSKAKPEPYRNYAAVGAADLPMFRDMENEGLVRRVDRTVFSDYDCYECTQAGMDAAMASFRGIQWPRSKRRYHTYLAIRDVLGELTFREFLTSDEFRESRP